MNGELKSKLESYKPPTKVVKIIDKCRPVFLVGVTAAGKDTILRALIKKSDYHHVVSHTTRPPRENHGIMERSGVEYHFISFKDVNSMLKNGGFIEAKIFSNNVYGTSVAEFQMAHDEGKIAITDIEVQGVAEYHQLSEQITPVFILPPDFKTWQERLKRRNADDNKLSEDELRRRLKTAERELKEALSKSYFEFVINDDLKRAIKAVDDIAHGKKSETKNEESKKIALELLKELEIYLQ